LIDGVGFAQGNARVARLWPPLLRRLALLDPMVVFLLDRGGAPAIAGVERIDFPSYIASYTAADSLLIQEFCDKLNIDVFSSTAYTTAITTPQVHLVDELALKVSDAGVPPRSSKERRLALSYSSHFACVGERARDGLRRHHPEIDPSRLVVLSCGVESAIFNASAAQRVQTFRATFGLSRPYVLVDRALTDNVDDDGSRCFLDAIRIDQAADFDVICLDAEPKAVPSLRDFPPGLTIRWLELSDGERAAAYAGALAFVQLSDADAFGMAVLEAMASDCPVMILSSERRDEAGSAQAIMSVELDSHELLQALEHVRQPTVRRRLIDAGRMHASKSNWDAATHVFLALLYKSRDEREEESVMEFHRRWKKIRTLQSFVDIGLD
jgi:hypothetical protein